VSLDTGQAGRAGGPSAGYGGTRAAKNSAAPPRGGLSTVVGVPGATKVGSPGRTADRQRGLTSPWQPN